MVRFFVFFVLFFLTACASFDNKDGRGGVFSEVREARSRLLWAGVYQGILPCEDCDGKALMLTLEANFDYLLRSRELGKAHIDTKESGHFVWLEGDSRIRLSESGLVFRVGRGALELLQEDGSVFADRSLYLLEKTD